MYWGHYMTKPAVIAQMPTYAVSDWAYTNSVRSIVHLC